MRDTEYGADRAFWRVPQAAEQPRPRNARAFAPSEDDLMRSALRNKIIRSPGVNFSSVGSIPAAMLNDLGLGIPERTPQGFAVGLDPNQLSDKERMWIQALARRYGGG